jgi:hypothetical protein
MAHKGSLTRKPNPWFAMHLFRDQHRKQNLTV